MIGTWWGGPGSAAITRALLHFIWEGALIALALALLLEVFRPRSARFRYAVACAAMLAMLGAFGLTIAKSWPDASSPVPVQPALLQTAPPPAFPSMPASAPSGDWLRWLVPLWMAGVAVFGTRSVASCLAAQRLRRIGICAAPEYWQRKIVELSEARLPALAVNGGRLMHRIKRLLGRSEPPHGVVAPALLAGALAISIAVAIGATRPPSASVPSAIHALKPVPPMENSRPLLLAQAQSNPRPNGRAGTPQQTPYEKWLNEEAIYIITDAERNAFLALRTDEERQHFIEQFWQRRDPTPGTPENEFQEEHYRRIAYANSNFAYLGTPGWTAEARDVLAVLQKAVADARAERLPR